MTPDYSENIKAWQNELEDGIPFWTHMDFDEFIEDCAYLHPDQKCWVIKVGGKKHVSHEYDFSFGFFTEKLDAENSAKFSGFGEKKVNCRVVETTVMSAMCDACSAGWEVREGTGNNYEE